jgi:hypothetical protein
VTVSYSADLVNLYQVMQRHPGWSSAEASRRAVWASHLPTGIGRERRSQRGESTQCSFKAKIKGQSVVITSHPPRKLRAVRNVTRWMEQGTEWVLVQKKE